MSNESLPKCPQCGAPISSDDPAGLCPRCLVGVTEGGKTEIPPIDQSPSGRARRKPILASAAAAVRAILTGGLRWANGWKKGSDAVAHYNRGVDLQEEGKLEEAAAAFQKVIGREARFGPAWEGLLQVRLDQGRFDIGVISTFAMSAGVALTICVIGLSSRGLNRALSGKAVAKRARIERVRRVLSLGGAFFITAFAAWQVLALAAGWKAMALI